MSQILNSIITSIYSLLNNDLDSDTKITQLKKMFDVDEFKKHIYIKNINSFSELKLIGSGGFGIVFSGRHNIDGVIYAIKNIPIQNDILPKHLNEIRMLAKLNHPNIIRYHRSWVEPFDARKFNNRNLIEDIDMEFQDETSLNLLLQMEKMDLSLREYMFGNIKKQDKFFIITEIIKGLLYLHRNNIIHGDIKPENILLCNINTQLSNVKISDFGLANFNTIDAKEIEYTTKTYSAPEKHISFSVDIFSLGILVFELLNSFKTEMERYEKIKLFKDGHIGSPFLKKMIHSDPSQRPSLKIVSKYFKKKLKIKKQVVDCHRMS